MPVVFKEQVAHRPEQSVRGRVVDDVDQRGNEGRDHMNPLYSFILIFFSTNPSISSLLHFIMDFTVCALQIS